MWVPPGYVSAFEAIEQLGRKKYGTEWTGNEKKAAGAPIPSRPKPGEIERISSSLATHIKYRPGAEKQRAGLELMKASAEKKAKEKGAEGFVHALIVSRRRNDRCAHVK